jgi:hypothetical protein
MLNENIFCEPSLYLIDKCGGKMKKRNRSAFIVGKRRGKNKRRIYI